MVAALNALCAEEGLASLDFELARAQVSNGAVGLLRLAFPDFEAARDSVIHQRFLDLYAARLARETRVFPDLEPVLEELELASVRWGVVTNKPTWLTEPLLEALGLLRRSACTISGDTLPERKPHPRPLLHALQQLGAAPAESVYVGDARRDIESGRSAGTCTVAVRYGYVEPGQDPANWGADYIVDSPAALGRLLKGTD
jgi:phosphoglycolate phosphatase